MILPKIVLAAALIAATTANAKAHEISGPADDYVYELAAPSSYLLPVIKPAAGGLVLDENGVQSDLKHLLLGRLTILAFIYTRCADVCPLATITLAKLREIASQAYNGKLRLITMSFDPDYDTPERMGDLAQAFRDPQLDSRVPWLFLTAPSRASIAPILAAYNQPIVPKADKNDSLGPINHLMRVFLIDDLAHIRNVYSPDFLDPRLLLNDLRNLQEAQSQRLRSSASARP